MDQRMAEFLVRTEMDDRRRSADQRRQLAGLDRVPPGRAALRRIGVGLIALGRLLEGNAPSPARPSPRGASESLAEPSVAS